MFKKTIRDLDLRGKRVLVRVDYNVSLSNDFRIGDDLRIKQTLPTLEYLLAQNCTLFLISHLGRPEGKVDPSLSLEPVRAYLEKLIAKPVALIKDYIDGTGKAEVKAAQPGSVNLLENIRFYPEEEANDPGFSQKLAALGEVFVNDAFGVCHRTHASTVGMTKFLPSVAGLLLEKEVDLITQAVGEPKRPLVVIVGGAKAETKIPLIESLLPKADTILVGGGVANTFLLAQGHNLGKSMAEPALVEKAKAILQQGQNKIILPADVVVGDLEKGSYEGVVALDQVPENLSVLDLGPKTEVEFGKIIEEAQTIIWNGPMGLFEKPAFARGTEFVYQAIAENRDSLSIVGGGETLTALPKEEYLGTIDHVSTGGGAMLEFIEKGTLPGIDALLDK
ncbi:phosphoglycerate kinase [Candidatus Beckwithbacteria bacterium RBG_13_42_9]|uniref:Phosphoglycerate kinase n=1 Tax=Candidatus Beckwithbacteria bacterium RBG_13_42_9 TaxID=1797457 RepID=A0A1F5E659_9BACT|nr:MAG: phosphoglycerate kinase [Candidatus Beckwithbacteria bacterium RBG_13_42_9]